VITVDIPIKNPKKPPKLVFPDRCANCGKPKVKTWPVRLNTGAQKSGQMIQVSFDVPLCSDCSIKENKIGNVTWIPFFIVGLLVCVIVFVPVWLLSPEGTMPQTYAFPYVLGAFVGMMAGMIAGTLVEFILKMSFASTYGKLLLKRPLTIISVFNDSEDVIGLSTRFADNKKVLKISFENDEIAREFVALNPQENG
jgi:hypothetical protein